MKLCLFALLLILLLISRLAQGGKVNPEFDDEEEQEEEEEEDDDEIPGNSDKNKKTNHGLPEWLLIKKDKSVPFLLKYTQYFPYA